MRGWVYRALLGASVAVCAAVVACGTPKDPAVTKRAPAGRPGKLTAYLLTEADVNRAPGGSPEAALLRFWRAL